MFQSIYTITFTITILSIILPSVLLWKNPYTIVKTAVLKLITNKKMLLHFVALFLILYINKIEQTLGENFIKTDFTPVISGWEGDIVYLIQQLFLNDGLTYLLTFFYIIVFPVIMVASVILYLNIDDTKSYYNFVYALMLNYAIAIPFYLFFPVFEVWHYDPHHVSFLIPDIYSKFELEYRPLSGINNNFPSLHTSISVSLALIAVRSKNINFGKIALVSASLIVFSTMYLGIHWISDLTAGFLLALIASQTGERLSYLILGEDQLYVRNNYR